MSNSLVGQVYASIIDEVVNSSRVDFEENGVDEAVLEELRQVWQMKLTQLDVATFPWDPQPEPPQPPQPPAVPPPLPQSVIAAQQLHEPTLALPGAEPAGGSHHGARQDLGLKQEPGIKQEPGTTSSIPLPQFPSMDSKNSIAASRAAQQLQAQYGNRAAGSISALRDGMHQQPGTQGQQPDQTQAQDLPNSSYANGQTDGAGDDEDLEGVLLHKTAEGDLRELGRVDIDRLLHAKIAANAKAMEGGGLMLPLQEATRRTQPGTTPRRPRQQGKAVANYDGEDDDQEEDEDAINSDLDDPEEDRVDDDDGDEGLGHIMLCMYDKVQRVKNKWKCILKDGVLTVNGKEYVFHKATGEFEW